MNKDITIIVLSYNTREITNTCLQKIKQATKYCETVLHNKVYTIVVDNGSHDGSVTSIRKNHPFVKLIALKKNVGFGPGNNIAMKQAKTPYILLLNSDAFLEKDTLVKSVEYMNNHKKVDVLCPHLLHPDRSFQPVGGFIPTPFKTIRWILGFESLFIVNRFLKKVYMLHKSFYKKEHQLEWGSGAFLFLKSTVYKKTHGFDENIFLYMEDIEWCQRIKKCGFTIFYTPTIPVTHIAGASSTKAKQKENIQRNITGLLYFHKKHYPKTVNLIKRFLVAGISLRIMFFTLIGDIEQANLYRSLII